MEYITTKEASAKWGISTTRITILANEGRIPGAQRLGKSWLIPANATKPPEHKAHHSRKANEEADDFSFPLYHFRSDWSYIKESQLSKQQKSLLLAETAVLECRFEDAYSVLESIMQAPDDIVTEIGCLWYAGICCIALNKPDDFSRIYLRLQIIMAKKFPHRDDLVIVLDTLKTYVETIGTIEMNDTYNTDINEQCLPLLSLHKSYSILSKEALKPGTADTKLLEINLRFLNNTSSVVAVEMMHAYLLGIYYLRQDMEAAIKHAKCLVQIAFENKFYFPLVTYYHYFASILSPILAKYPAEFQKRCSILFSQYEENLADFLSALDQYAVIAKLTDIDYPFLYAVLLDLPNTLIAERLGISPRTVKNRLDKICKLFGVANKKALKDYIRNYM